MVNSQREVKEIETKLQSMSERQVEVAVELKKAKSGTKSIFSLPAHVPKESELESDVSGSGEGIPQVS